MLEVAKECFKGLPLPKFFTSSFIILISKVKEPTSLDKFRPTSLYPVAYKNFFKILVGRLTSCLSQIIGLEQGSFLPGQSIFENITLTYEMMQSINRKNTGENVVLNVDVAKAYGRVD